VAMALRMLRSSAFGRVVRGATGRAVNWERLIFRYSDPAKKEALQSLSARYAEVNALHASLPKAADGVTAASTPPIDWQAWRKVIRTPGVVDAYQAKYEAATKKEAAVDNAGLARRLQENDAELAVASAAAAKAASNIEALQREIRVWQWEKDNIDELTVEYYLAKYPGLHEKIINQCIDDDWFAGDENEKLFSVDLKELRRQLNEGNVRALAALSFAADRKTISIGPYKDLPVPSREEQIKNPACSIIWQAAQIRKQDAIAAGV